MLPNQADNFAVCQLASIVRISQTLRLFIVGFLLSLLGGASGAEPPKGKLSVADGFVDIDLPISKTESSFDKPVSIVARGKIKGSVVGFAVDIDSEWAENPIEDTDASFYWGKAHLRSIGADSDSFSRLLAGLYQLPCAEPRMPARIDVGVVGLANDPRLLKTNPTKMKLFFNVDSEENYAEVFLNIDFKSGVLQFHEKDPEYRIPLLRALCGES